MQMLIHHNKVKSIIFEEVSDKNTGVRDSHDNGAVVDTSNSKETSFIGATSNNTNEFLTFAQKIQKGSNVTQ